MRRLWGHFIEFEYADEAQGGSRGSCGSRARPRRCFWAKKGLHFAAWPEAPGDKGEQCAVCSVQCSVCRRGRLLGAPLGLGLVHSAERRLSGV